MNDDIVARLREFESVPTMLGFHGLAQLMTEAADEIERLRAENERLRKRIVEVLR